MIELRQTTEFETWLTALADLRAKARIAERVRRLALGHYGDVKSVGGGVSELRIDYGPGYRVYLTKRGTQIVLLLCGGDKSSQTKDITKAKALAKRE